MLRPRWPRSVIFTSASALHLAVTCPCNAGSLFGVSAVRGPVARDRLVDSSHKPRHAPRRPAPRRPRPRRAQPGAGGRGAASHRCDGQRRGAEISSGEVHSARDGAVRTPWKWRRRPKSMNGIASAISHSGKMIDLDKLEDLGVGSTNRIRKRSSVTGALLGHAASAAS